MFRALKSDHAKRGDKESVVLHIRLIVIGKGGDGGPKGMLGLKVSKSCWSDYRSVPIAAHPFGSLWRV